MANWLTVGGVAAFVLFAVIAAHAYVRVTFDVWEFVPVSLRNNRVQIGEFVFSRVVPAKIRSTYLRCWGAASAAILCIGVSFVAQHQLKGAMIFSGIGGVGLIRTFWLARRNRSL
jgi:hypothetical protein